MESENYDSSVDTLKHIKRVNELLLLACKNLMNRAMVHDSSKLQTPEKELFDLLTPKLKEVEYDSPEYKTFLEALKPALDHHYAKNAHHPEHYEDGVDGMNLFDVVEMFFDWKASSERQNNGNIMKSIKIQKDRYELSDQLTNIFRNTAKYLGW